MRAESERRRGRIVRLGSLCACTVLAAISNRAEAICARPIVGGGAVHISPRSASGPLVVSEIGGQPVSMPAPGSGVEALSANTLLLLAECERDDHLKFRFVFGIPPTHELRGTGTLSDAGVIGDGQQWSPTMLAIYTFLPPDSGARPFVGAGFNYTFFRRARVTNDAFRAANFGPDAVTKVSLSRSWNPVATVGVAFRIDPRWSVEAAASYAPIETRITVSAENTSLGVPVKAFSDVKNRTVTGSVTINYRWGR